MCDSLFPHIVCCACCVRLTPRDIEITSHDDPFTFGDQVSYSRIQCIEEAISKIISCATAIRWAVDSEDDKCRELEHYAAAFGIQKCGVDSKSFELNVREITADVLVRWEVTVGDRRVGRTKDAKYSFLCSNGCADGVAGVDADP